MTSVVVARPSTHSAADVTSSFASAGAHAANATSSLANTEVVVHRSSRLDAAILHTQAKVALTALGWKPAIAHAAVTAAAAVQGAELKLERLIFESLRRCPAPRA
jgi:Holliday junction resolvasome RuvABC DNA-binding subunit